MKKLITIGTVSVVFISACLGGVLPLSKPQLSEPPDGYDGLASNAISTIRPQGDSTLWLATGTGLSRTDDFGSRFHSYYSGVDSLPHGGISSIAVQDSVIWVAAVFDSSTITGEQRTGGGLSYSTDYGDHWVYVPQPLDDPGDSLEIWGSDTIQFLPVTTPIQNTTWDLSLTDRYVYIVSWAGGLRRSADFGASWQRIPLPSDEDDYLDCGPVPYQINPRDPAQGGNHNHKGFSVLAYGDTVWVGTANGINFGLTDPDGCIRWHKYTAQNSAISGNWVVTLARQVWRGQETIWASTLPAEGANEFRAVSKSSDGGRNWTSSLYGERVNDFAFHDSVVYACTENGIYKSIDGENWAVHQPVSDETRNEYLLTHNVFTACLDTREGLPYLWIGTADGIAKTADDGLHWSVYRYAVSPEKKSEIYAYPNPFAPNLHNVLAGEGHVRIRHHMEGSGTVRLEIYDFAMQLVYRGRANQILAAGDYDEIWNGNNQNGVLVANGTYFCKVTQMQNGNETVHWTKLIVVK